MAGDSKYEFKRRSNGAPTPEDPFGEDDDELVEFEPDPELTERINPTHH